MDAQSPLNTEVSKDVLKEHSPEVLTAPLIDLTILPRLALGLPKYPLVSAAPK